MTGQNSFLMRRPFSFKAGFASSFRYFCENEHCFVLARLNLCLNQPVKPLLTRVVRQNRTEQCSHTEKHSAKFPLITCIIETIEML